MRKLNGSKLNKHAAELEEWFEGEQITAKEAKERLAKLGCEISLGRLYEWWSERRARNQEERFLERIERGAGLCKRIEARFGKNPAPAIETLIKVQRVLLLNLSAKTEESPAVGRLIATLMKPLLDWSRIEQRKKEKEEELILRREEIEKRRGEEERDGEGDGLRPETLQKIERELNLL